MPQGTVFIQLHVGLNFFSHSQQVQEHSAVNKMTAKNLAIVFGPNLVWSKSQAASLDAMAQINSFTLLMLENVSYLFETS